MPRSVAPGVSARQRDNALERVSPTLVSTYTFVNPIIAVLLGWAFLGESFTTSTLIGGTLVVGSIIGLLVFDTPADEQRNC